MVQIFFSKNISELVFQSVQDSVVTETTQYTSWLAVTVTPSQLSFRPSCCIERKGPASARLSHHCPNTCS